MQEGKRKQKKKPSAQWTNKKPASPTRKGDLTYRLFPTKKKQYAEIVVNATIEQRVFFLKHEPENSAASDVTTNGEE